MSSLWPGEAMETNGTTIDDEDPHTLPGLRSILRNFYSPEPEQYASTADGERARIWAEGAPNAGQDAFASQLMTEAVWLSDRLQDLEGEPKNKRFFREDYNALRTSIKRTNKLLSKITPSLEAFLGPDIDMEQTKATLSCLARAIEQAKPHVEQRTSTADHDSLPQIISPAKTSYVEEIALRVARVLNSHRMRAPATAIADTDTASPVVRILKIIGDNVIPPCHREIVTWRDALIRAKELDENIDHEDHFR